jgi:hypothetical protein
MADESGRAVDTVVVVRARSADLDGYWPGGAGHELAYWRRRCAAAEARAERLREELDRLLRRGAR